MKRVDMDDLILVHCGEAWPHAQPPCSRQMIQHLERNEGVVTWVQVSWNSAGKARPSCCE